MFTNMTPVVKQLLIINVICYIMSFVAPNAYEYFSMYYFENPHFRIWQPITHMFMHSKDSIMHIVFNMFALVSFGSVLEHFWGAKRFLLFYFVCGIGASILHTLVNYYNFHLGLDILVQNEQSYTQIFKILEKGQFNTEWQKILQPSDFNNFVGAYMIPAVGASGAIYGLLVAFAFMFPNAELAMMFIPIPIKAKYFVPLMIIFYDGFFGVLGSSSDGVAHFAHIGGAITGFILMWVWKNKKFTHNRWN